MRMLRNASTHERINDANAAELVADCTGSASAEIVGQHIGGLAMGANVEYLPCLPRVAVKDQAPSPLLENSLWSCRSGLRFSLESVAFQPPPPLETG